MPFSLKSLVFRSSKKPKRSAMDRGQHVWDPGIWADELNIDQVSSVQIPGWLFYIEDNTIPTHIAIVISQYNEPSMTYETISIMECHKWFERFSTNHWLILHVFFFTSAKWLIGGLSARWWPDSEEIPLWKGLWRVSRMNPKPLGHEPPSDH